ncbi:Tyrosine-protein phosphatase non-receptor type 12 [Collichthys lucidus]|uniref:protein-tyrosine-phosphatase n=1 Tax=Collichthys lucidus TaxID=240159 RepID=A0A4U5UQ10_COLLU|nr:Tyrosine-protein phosphatase non-receptor type 12 [Collichthys lucidus]
MEHQTWVLRNFLTQLERQEAVDKEATNGIAGEFARLKSQSTKYRTDKTFPTKIAEKQDNIKKNRYKDIVPFDHSRVKLTLTTTKNDTDYINASFIKGVSGSRAYIATQGPLPHTVLDFLRMLWEYNIKVVVMACREFEMGKKKCERYWPLKQEQPFVCEPFTVYCDSEEPKGDYLTRTLRVTYHNSSRTLQQLHYVNWPDHGVPDSIPPILEMLYEMRSYQAHDDVPLCIHCSAGCGRTGALCVIDYTWNLLKKQMITPNFSIFDLVQNMRTQRPSVVQTKEQYELVYRTIRLLFERYLQSMDAQTGRNVVTMVPSTIALDTESDLIDLSEELELLPQLQKLLDEERAALAQSHAPSPALENPNALEAKDKLRQQQQQWHLLQTVPEAFAATTTHDLQKEPRASPKPVRASQRAPAVDEVIQGSNDIPPPKPPPAVAAVICHMVEDPYFDTPLSSPSSEEAPADPVRDDKQWTVSSNQPLEPPVLGTVEIHIDEEVPPPLPQRTPESYVLAVDEEIPDPCERLMVTIPPNAAAEAVRELGGSPSSPVPPLPERTPESFELAVDQAPVEQKLEVTPAVCLNRIGTSSEWSGDSKPAAAAAASHSETKVWVRSKPVCAPLTPLLLTAQTEESDTPPLPDRTRESFILATEEVPEKTSLSPKPLETTTTTTTTRQHSSRVGLSSEWDGTAQPRSFLDVVKSRSKSVRAKGSRPEPLTAARQLPSPPAVVAEGGSAQVGHADLNHRSSLSIETSGNKSDKSSEKGLSRTKRKLPLRHLHQSVPHYQCSDSDLGTGSVNQKDPGVTQRPGFEADATLRTSRENLKDHERLLKISWKIKYCEPEKTRKASSLSLTAQ